jgi:hypothetical protein
VENQGRNSWFKFRGGAKESTFLGKFFEKGWGLPIFWPGREKNGIKFCLLTPIGQNTQKIAQTTSLGPFLALYSYFLRFSQCLPFFGHFW